MDGDPWGVFLLRFGRGRAKPRPKISIRGNRRREAYGHVSRASRPRKTSPNPHSLFRNHRNQGAPIYYTPGGGGAAARRTTSPDEPRVSAVNRLRHRGPQGGLAG